MEINLNLPMLFKSSNYFKKVPNETGWYLLISIYNSTQEMKLVELCVNHNSDEKEFYICDIDGERINIKEENFYKYVWIGPFKLAED